MEIDIDQPNRADHIFNNTLMNLPNIQLWTLYLDQVRRRHNTTYDTSKRQIVAQVYEFVLQNVGVDKEAGQIWQDYARFIASGLGTVGGDSWQDKQKMDLLRKTYQTAICIPTQAVGALWKEYDQLEMGLNKMTVSDSTSVYVCYNC